MMSRFQNNHGNDHDYEMDSYGDRTTAAAQVLGTQDFLQHVQDVRDQIASLTAKLDTLSQLHHRALHSTSGHDETHQQLEQVLAQTQSHVSSVWNSIKHLGSDVARTMEGSVRGIKSKQLETLRASFRVEMDRFRALENDYHVRSREQIARQYRIVNPDATEHEVQLATEAGRGNEGVFQTELRTNRSSQATSALGIVRARHNELQRIEQTLNELALIYEELATVIDHQDVQIQTAERNAEETYESLEKGTEQVEIGVKHAQNRRKLKWWLALVIFLIILVVAIAVSVKVCVVDDSCKSK